MPRNGSGVYSKPAGTTAVANTLIESAKYNQTIDDLVTDANTARPVVAGGTGATSVAAAQSNLSVDNKVVYVTKSGAYTAVATDNNGVIECTATLTLSLTAAATLGANWHAWVYANGGDVTVDPNSSELINGAATLSLPNGFSALIICTGSAFKAIVVRGAPPYAAKTGAYTAVASDNGGVLRFTTAATLSLTAAATLGSGWRTKVIAYGVDVTIDPNSTEQINGAATFILRSGQAADIVCDGSAFWADVHADTLSGPQLQGYSTGLALTTNALDAANDVDIAVGAAAADTSPYYLMQLTSALTKRIDAAWAVGTNQGGLDTGSVANATYYIWLIQRSDTGVTDVLFSLSSTAPTMPTSYDRKRLLGLLVRASATNSAPYLNAKSIGNTGPILLSKGAVPTTAATDFAIPVGVERITFLLSAFSTNGTSIPMIQLKTGGTPETSGYSGAASAIGNGASPSGSAYSSGFSLTGNNAAASVYHVTADIIRQDGNTWEFIIKGGLSNSPATILGGGSKTLAGVLDGIRLTTFNGTEVPDAGVYTLYVEY